ncbi:MAG: homoserine kinase [Streptosporangiales bacterium]|nr:homoserine kinase [Streptosporangiales bacterium]
MDWIDGPVRVRVPATSANLGPGFDTLGLALARYDEVEARVADGGLDVEVAGEGSADVRRDESHLVVRAMHATFDAMGARPAGLRLTCVNRIPHSRGLGSSAAAITAGVAAARALAGLPEDRDAVFRTAATIEGHPDNVAPCAYGGATIAWSQDGEWRATRLTPSPELRPVICVPDWWVSTERARALLPDTVPYGDAALNAGRAALLVVALTRSPALLMDATVDRLHQEYRRPAMPAALELTEALRDVGVPAVISGAGPSVLALGQAGNPATTADSIGRITGTGWHIHPLDADLDGLQVQAPVQLPGS